MPQSLNRTKQPDVKSIDKIEKIRAEKILLDNNIPLYTLSAGEEEIIKIDFIFPAGIWYQDKPFIATTTNSMINEGTSTLTSMQIAEKLDYYGAFLNLNVERNYSFVTLFSLTKHLPRTLEIISEIISDSIFPEKEFQTYIGKKRQQVIFEFSKVKTLSRKKFDEVLFGNNHPYGLSAEIEDLDKVDIGSIKSFYKNRYSLQNCQIIAAGKITEDVISLLNKYFGSDKKTYSQSNEIKRDYEIISSKEKVHIVNKEGAVQSSIRLGKLLFNRLHPDFNGLRVLNMVLGGYFGSRLMSNIREDKGYTYGIGSVVHSMKDAGYLTIISEVGTEVCKAAITEILYELKRLREELIPEEELERVRNYMLGEIIRQFDGPFSLSDSLWTLLEYDLDYNHYDDLITTVRKITPAQLQKLAEQYFQESTVYQVIAGKYE